uniref:Lipocalin n=1 Tax=Rhipicephalus zambeziensis TaxID=60191 RepID=A0A224YDM1_9ACAR
MAAQKLFIAFILVDLMMSLKTQRLPIFTENVDITKFYAINERIWTVKTTKPTTMTCKFDLVYARTRNGIRFERQYYWFGSRINLYLEGTFISKPIFKTTYNAMKVTKKDSIFKSIDHLLYSYRNYACGIFKVTLLHPEQSKHYELRVKDSAFVEPKRSCIEKFENISKGGRITTVYSSACKATRTL